MGWWASGLDGIGGIGGVEGWDGVGVKRVRVLVRKIKWVWWNLCAKKHVSNRKRAVS